MPPGRYPGRMLGLCIILSLWGCMVPKSRLNVCQTQNRALTEKNAALQSEVENLRIHQDHLVRKLQQTEEELTLVRQENQVVRRRLELKENPSQPTDTAYIPGLMGLSPESRLRLDQLAKRFPPLGLNPASGECRLLSEGLFPPGQAKLTPEAEARLASLAQLLQSAEGQDLRVWIVAQSAEGSSGRRGASEANNPAQQALAVSEKLRSMGVAGSRIGLAAVGTPTLPATTSGQSSPGPLPPMKVFLLPPETPVVGWNFPATRMY